RRPRVLPGRGPDSRPGEDHFSVSGDGGGRRSTALGAGSGQACGSSPSLPGQAAPGNGAHVAREDGGGAGGARGGDRVIGVSSAGPQPRPSFIYGNIVFGRDLGDAWALYKLSSQSYAGLSTGRKLEVMGQLEGLVHRISADFQILRIARRFSVRDYVASTWRTFDRRHGSAEEIERRKSAFEKLLRAHAYALSERETVRPDIYLAVRLEDANSGFAELLGEGGLAAAWKRFAGAVGINDPRGRRYSKLVEIERDER